MTKIVSSDNNTIYYFNNSLTELTTFMNYFLIIIEQCAIFYNTQYSYYNMYFHRYPLKHRFYQTKAIFFVLL
jgi:hypothetical protein